MSFQVRVLPSGRQFQTEADETILAAALRQGVALPYGCRNGACGSCKGSVIGGDLKQGPHAVGTLDEREKALGKALFCCAYALSDITIECREVVGDGAMLVKKLPSRVISMVRASDDVMILKLQLPATERMQFLAGQYVDFILKDGKRRSYSIAQSPHIDGPLEFHLRHLPGGVFTDFVFSATAPAMKERDILRFEGPLGSFFLREDVDKPIVMLASGTGFAPLKAMIEYMHHVKIRRPVVLYWGGRRPKDLYMHQLCLSWANMMPELTYIPVISDALAEDHWTGRTGLVHKAVMEDIPNLSAYQVYACGAPIMVSSAREELIAQCALPENEFYADAFISEAELAESAS